MKKSALKIGCVLLTGASLGACGGTAIDGSQGDGDDDTGIGGSYGGGPIGTGGTAGVQCDPYNCGTGGFLGTGGATGTIETGGAPGIYVGTMAPTFEDYYAQAEVRAMCPYASNAQFIHSDVIRPLATQADQIIFSSASGVYILSPSETEPTLLSSDASVRQCVVEGDELFCAGDTLLRIPLSGAPSISYPYKAGGVASGAGDFFALDSTSQSLIFKASGDTDFSVRGAALTALPSSTAVPLSLAENTDSIFFAQPWYETNRQLSRISKESGTAEVMNGDARVVSMHADNTHLYAIQYEYYELMRYDLTTAVATPWLQYWHSPVSISGDDSSVYWSTQSPYYQDSAILRTPKSSGFPAEDTRILAQFPGATEGNLVPSANCLFWVVGGELYATAK